MRTVSTLLLALSTSPAFASNDAGGPRIGSIEWEDAQTICEAWPAGTPAGEARDNGLSFVSYPATVKPFGMRGYMAIDGRTHPLKQIAYAKTGGTLSIYYRTLGDTPHDVYLTLSGFASDDLKGSGLSGTLVASRFGLFSTIEISGRCGATG